MEPIIRYIEHKPAEHTDSGTAWIARMWPSKSGKTLYFNDMALKRANVPDANHYDLVSGKFYWVSGVKKSGSNRHWAGGGKILIERSLLNWYENHVDTPDLYALEPINDFPKPDISKFTSIENKPL